MVFDFVFWSGWVGIDGLVLDSIFFVVNIFIDIVFVVELFVIGVYGGIGRIFWEGWVVIFKFIFGGVFVFVDYGVSVFWVI